ncbi:unnamed protein product [Amoebophrya sp. A120]|nr:unnamed protein product [Amoebophrya sp. A120]|eukprot:GSA120T00000813001.1
MLARLRVRARACVSAALRKPSRAPSRGGDWRKGAHWLVRRPAEFVAVCPRLAKGRSRRTRKTPKGSSPERRPPWPAQAEARRGRVWCVAYGLPPS